jgi:hypothetical protein
LADDYKPFHIVKDSDIENVGKDNDSDRTSNAVPKSVVTDRVFEKLKIKEDQLNAEMTTRDFYIRTRTKKKISRDYSFEESKLETTRPATINQSLGQGDISRVSKGEESDEELITEELFQKALQAALENKSLAQKKKKKLKQKSKKSRLNKSLKPKKSEKSNILARIREKKNIKESLVVESFSRRNISMIYSDKFKYKPLCPALPPNLPTPPTIADRIRAAKKLHMTRRDMTEQKIIKNIQMHNNPADLQNFEVLYISNRNDNLADAFREDEKSELPLI